MRLAIVTDIHGNLPALEVVWHEIRQVKPDLVVNLGDIASGPLWPQETVRWLMAREREDPGRWATLRGNHERQLLEPDIRKMSAADAYAARALGPAEKAWLAALPVTCWLADDILLCHGTPDSDLRYFLETIEAGWTRGGFAGIRAATAAEVRERAARAPQEALAGAGRGAALADDGRTGLAASLILCGHTHVQRMMTVVDGPVVVNAGSVGLPGYDDGHGQPHVVEAGTPHARWAVVERIDAPSASSAGDARDPAARAPGRPCWRVELRASAYDWTAASNRAAGNGRGDWADVLATGFMGRFENDAAVPGGG
jgi:predicted phosphodiesterase